MSELGVFGEDTRGCIIDTGSCHLPKAPKLDTRICRSPRIKSFCPRIAAQLLRPSYSTQKTAPPLPPCQSTHAPECRPKDCAPTKDKPLPAPAPPCPSRSSPPDLYSSVRIQTAPTPSRPQSSMPLVIVRPH